MRLRVQAWGGARPILARARARRVLRRHGLATAL